MFGFVKIDNIKIPQNFKPPRLEKMQWKRMYFKYIGKYEQPIVLDKNDVLIDGYTTYLLAKEHGKKYIRVRRRMNNENNKGYRFIN